MLKQASKQTTQAKHESLVATEAIFSARVVVGFRVLCRSLFCVRYRHVLPLVGVRVQFLFLSTSPTAMRSEGSIVPSDLWISEQSLPAPGLALGDKMVARPAPRRRGLDRRWFVTT